MILERPNPCERCRQHRKKCDLQVICSRCFSAGASCIYTARRGACESSPHSPSTSASETPSLLERVLEASDTSSGVDPKSPSISCYSLIDADLAPTLDDYMIVATMFDTITHFEPLQMLGPRAFLDRFFMQPPHLRLSLVALALYFRAESEAIPSHVLLTSYKRARKSIMRYMDIMSLQTMQAFYFLSRVANHSGQTTFSGFIFGLAIKVYFALQFHVDPDCSSKGLLMSEEQKEEQRTWAWHIADCMKVYQVTGMHDFAQHIDLSRLKPATGIAARLPRSCFFNDLILDMKRHHKLPPSCLLKLFVSPELLKLHSRLVSIFSIIPRDNILFPIQPSLDGQLSSKDDLFRRFHAQLAPLSKSSQMDILMNSEQFFVATSLLHRPRLHLLAILTPQACTPQIRAELLYSYTHLFHALHHYITLEQFIYANTQFEPTSASPKLFNPDVTGWPTALTMFEAATTLWLLACKMKSGWRDLLPQVQPLEQLALHLESLCVIICRLENDLRAGGDTATLITPLAQCLQGMHLESENVRVQGGVVVPDAVIGLTVFCLEEEGGLELRAVRTDAEALAYVGLLGFRVLGGIELRGNGDAEWRRWWEKVKQDGWTGELGSPVDSE